jgi:hypothetical protein
MLDDIRSHNASPSAEERAWMSFDPLEATARVLVVLVLAFTIGGYVSYAMEAQRTVSVARH